MRSMEFSGRTVDEAIFHGLTEMGLSIDEVEITTVQNQSKGIFGIGAKNAVVRLTEREVKVKPVFEKPARTESAPRSRDNKPQGRREPRRDERPVRQDRPKQDEETEAIEDYPYTEEFANGQPSAIFLRDLLQRMNIEATVSGCQTEDGIRLNMVSSTDGLLIGRRGETLDALQHLVSLYANKGRKDEGYQRITIDTEGYRARRESTLRRLARKNAARVAKTGRSFAMEPMNPYERRVLHAALQSFRGVTTHSEGDEPNRRVVITPDR